MVLAYLMVHPIRIYGIRNKMARRNSINFRETKWQVGTASTFRNN